MQTTPTTSKAPSTTTELVDNEKVLATKVAVLWSAIASERVLKALEDPGSRAAKELQNKGVDARALHDVSVLMRASGLASLKQLHELFRMFCTPEPCRIQKSTVLKQIAAETDKILSPSH